MAGLQGWVNRPASSVEVVYRAVQALEQGQRVVLATLTNIEGNAPYPIGTQMLITDDGEYSGQITGGCAEAAIVDQAIQALNQGRSQSQRYGLGSPYFDIKLPCGSGIDVFFDCEVSLDDMRSIVHALAARQSVTRCYGGFEKRFLPATRIVLYGQGPIMTRLAQLSLQSECEVLCVAQNEETRSTLKANAISSLTLSDSATVLSSCDALTAIVSLFHEHDFELPILQEALTTSVFYIGALGSKRTHASRQQALLAAGMTEEQIARIHGPVGLDIGANTPSQIAVSILAEVIAEKNRRVWN